MATRKQTELPGTRRPDEPEPPKPIKAPDDACDELERERRGRSARAEPQPPKPIRAPDDACDELERKRGAAARAGQAVVQAKKAAQELLEKHNRDEYEYEGPNGVLKKIFRKSTVATCKVKVAKKNDDESD